MSLVLQSSGGGQITIQEPATASNFTATLPTADGTIVVSGTTPTLNGITFPATQVPSADANTLDDYEEGTFTPVLQSGAGSITSQNCSGRYTKIGRTVTIYVLAQIITAGTASGAMNLLSLPFSSADRASMAIVREDDLTGFAYMFLLNQNSTSGRFFTLTTNSNPPYTSGSLYTFTLTYQV
jgi:hypothetical protein